jgi:hypothetical protein
MFESTERANRGGVLTKGFSSSRYRYDSRDEEEDDDEEGREYANRLNNG